METVMKKLILAAALIAPLAAAPAFAQGAGDAAGFIETPAVTTYAPNQPREFTARTPHSAPLAPTQWNMIDREAVPSSAFSSSN
jgi:hypothetical protein